MKNFIITAVALAAFGAGPALAADLPAKPVPAPVYKQPTPVVVAYSWTGCFIGGNGGGIWAKKHWNADVGDPSGAPLGAEFSRVSPSGWMAGGQLGCDYQFNMGNGGFVIGIQGDGDWVSAKASAPDAVNDAFFATTGYTDHTSIKALYSVTGRIGYAWNRFLAYSRGGYAWEHDDYTIINPSAVTVASANETRGGWTIGGGAEYAFTNWLTGFVEYDYYDFGHRSNRFLTSGGTTFDVADIRERKQLVKAGLNLRWGPNNGGY